ncbi:hypothetical protein MMC25_003510 [Agyrium rufum]|nr:hypothetical protein [Agyrium rufum]
MVAYHLLSIPTRTRFWDWISSWINKAVKDGNTAVVERARFLKYGKTFEVNSWGTRCIHTMESGNIKAVLGQLFERFGVQPMRLHLGKPFIGAGVFSTDGLYWKHSRELIRPLFARAQITDLGGLDLHLDRMMEQIPTDGSTIDLQLLLKRMFLDHSTELLFGESTDTLLSATPDIVSNELLVTYDAALQGLGKRILLRRLRILFLWDRSYERLSRRVHAVIDKYIDGAIARREATTGLEKNPTGRTSGRLILIDEIASVIKEKAEIRDQILNIFLPSRDATGVGLSGICFLLARHPRVWAKLRDEILPLQGPITYDTLKSLTYLRCVIDESFRLIMPANKNIRLCLKSSILPTGGGSAGKAPIYIPQGTQISLNFGAMQRDRDIWGVDADEFRPERWEKGDLGANTEGKDAHRDYYMPFSMGPRVCPGQQLALTESAYVLVHLVRRFRVMENRDEVSEFVEQSRLTVESRNGAKVAFGV